MATLYLDHNSHARTVNNSHAYQPLHRLVNTFYVWADRAKKRRELRGLLTTETRILKDIGLQRHDISSEAFKRFWQA